MLKVGLHCRKLKHFFKFLLSEKPRLGRTGGGGCSSTYSLLKGGLRKESLHFDYSCLNRNDLTG